MNYMDIRMHRATIKISDKIILNILTWNFPLHLILFFRRRMKSNFHFHFDLCFACCTASVYIRVSHFDGEARFEGVG